MIPKKQRLPREAFRAMGYRTLKTPFFLIKTKKNDVGVNRMGVVVSVSVDKRAVCRNFWERQAKSQLLKAPDVGKDFIFIAFPKIITLTRVQFAEEIKKILKIAV